MSGADASGPRIHGAFISVLGLLVLFVGLVLAARAEAYVYWTVTSGLDTENIARANLNGSGVDTDFFPASCCEAPWGIALDDSHIYWANRDFPQINRVDLDGSDRVELIALHDLPSQPQPDGVAVGDNYVYWQSGDAIGRANVDGSSPDPEFIAERCTYLIEGEEVTQACDPELGQEIAYFPAPLPRDIAVDASHIYWTHGSSAIGRANLDGSNVDTSFITGSSNARGIAIDGSHIYWADAGSNAIGRADLDGSNVNQSFIAGATSPSDVAIDANYIYWATGTSGDIGRAELDASNVENAFITTPYNAVDIAVDALADTVPPETTIESAPPATTSDSSPTFSFSSEPGASFECRFDSDAFAGCSGPGDTHTPASPLSSGSHIFEVRATDEAGNTDPDPASHSFAVDTITTGDITTVAGTGSFDFSGDGGPATSAALNTPYGAAVDPSSGSLYIGDLGNSRVRKVITSGTITTVAGTGQFSFSGDDGPATAAALNDPVAVAVDGSGNFYIADSSNSRVRKVNGSGTITTVAGSGSYGFAGDGGPATSAELRSPVAVAVDGSGNLYLADGSSSRVRKVDGSGTITTVAGTGTAGFSGDGGPATSAQLGNWAYGLAVDGTGNLYIADTENHRVRMVDGSGTITTVAGTGTAGFSGDGGPGTAAKLDSPTGLAVDDSGNLFIADANNNRVRRVDGSGTITTVAGTGTEGFSGDGGPATAAEFSGPWGLAFDSAGNLYIADHSNSRVRRVEPDTVPPVATINSGPSGATNDPTPTFGFSSEPGARFQCKVDSGSYATCNSPKGIGHLADGSHTFSVRATDAWGNTSAPAVRNFTVRTAEVRVAGSTILVSAAPGAEDNLQITRPSVSTVRVTDSPGGVYAGSGIHTGAGCTRSGDYTANCSASGITLIQVIAADQADRVVNSTGVKSSLNGGAADDLLTGGSGNDTLIGATGADVFRGMNGNDDLRARDLTSDTTINCDGGTSPGGADKADLDLLPRDPNSAIAGCETKTRH